MSLSYLLPQKKTWNLCIFLPRQSFRIAPWVFFNFNDLFKFVVSCTWWSLPHGGVIIMDFLWSGGKHLSLSKDLLLFRLLFLLGLASCSGRYLLAREHGESEPLKLRKFWSQCSFWKAALLINLVWEKIFFEQGLSWDSDSKIYLAAICELSSIFSTTNQRLFKTKEYRLREPQNDRADVLSEHWSAFWRNYAVYVLIRAGSVSSYIYSEKELSVIKQITKHDIIIIRELSRTLWISFYNEMP